MAGTVGVELGMGFSPVGVVALQEGQHSLRLKLAQQPHKLLTHGRLSQQLIMHPTA